MSLCLLSPRLMQVFPLTLTAQDWALLSKKRHLVREHVVQRLLILYCLFARQGGGRIAEMGRGNVRGGTSLLPANRGQPRPASPWEIHLPF